MILSKLLNDSNQVEIIEKAFSQAFFLVTIKKTFSRKEDLYVTNCC